MSLCEYSARVIGCTGYFVLKITGAYYPGTIVHEYKIYVSDIRGCHNF